MSKETTTSGGIGLAGILTIIFVVCKIFGVINWSWWWVLSPIWISWALVLAFIILLLFIAFITAIISAMVN